MATKITLNLEADLAEALTQAAASRGWSPESLAEECIRQNVEIALRHRVLVEGMEVLYDTIRQMSEVIAELAAPSSGVDLSKVCRFPKTG